MDNYHLYIASCCDEGGVYHYICRSGNKAPVFREKTTMNRPMYLDVNRESICVLLREPFHDNKDSGLQSWLVTADGALEKPGEIQSTRGIVACHLCRWKGHVYVANYLSGSVYGTNGALDIHQGLGANPKRQEAAHTHFIAPAPDGACLMSADLGLDRVYLYDEQLNVMGLSNVPKGHGARHLAYSQDRRTVFCVNELASTITAFDYSNAHLRALETVPVLSKPKDSSAAAIRVHGEYIYVSNRGDDSISCLRWENGNLSLESVTPCGGAFPRDFIIEGRVMWVANEHSGLVTSFEVDGPRLTQRDVCLTIPSPLCIVSLATEE